MTTMTAITTRTLNNAGNPFLRPDGSPISSSQISFVLVGATDNSPIDTWTASGHNVASIVSATANAQGEFSIDLVPNDLLSPSSRYLCHVPEIGTSFYGQVLSGAGSITWLEFYENNAPLTPFEQTILQAHIADNVRHVTQAEHEFLTNANLFLSYGYINPLPISFAGSSLASGHNDLYTVPAGKRLILSAGRTFNPTANTAQFYFQVKNNGVYYDLGANVTSSSNSFGAVSHSYIFDAGDVVSINVTAQSGINAFFGGVLIDDTSPLKSSKLFGLVSGNNTLLTVPAGKSIIPVSFLGVIGTSQVSIGVSTGGSCSGYINIVPNGDSPSSSNKLANITPAVNNVLNQSITGALSNQETINVNTNATSAPVLAWINYIEQ